MQDGAETPVAPPPKEKTKRKRKAAPSGTKKGPKTKKTKKN